MATIDRLIENLRADGSLDSQGRFTLDREQARAKMQKFQLVDARRYVLELVQAAILRDATYVTFEIDADDMHMRFDGSPFVAAEIDDLYGSLFADGDARPLQGVRQLALALNAALGMEPRHIHVRSGNLELRMAPGQQDQIVTHEQASPRTEIHVRQRLRARVLFDFFRNLTGRMAEEQHLRERCLYATVPVTLDGKTISGGLDNGEEGLASVAVVGRDFHGVMKIIARPTACALRLVKDGVWIDTREVPDCGTYLLAVVEGSNLRKDVSQAKIVANAALERIEVALRQVRWRLWRNAREHDAAQVSIEAMIREQLLDHASLKELKEIPEAIELSSRVTWPDCRGNHRQISLRELVERSGSIHFAAQEFPEVPGDDQPILLLTRSDERQKLERVLGRGLIHADNLLERERRRLLGHKAWRERTGEPELPSHLEFMVRTPIRFELSAGPVRGEIGIDAEFLRSPNGKAPSHLFMFKDGALLGRTELELGFLNLWVALEGPFEPNDDYTDAQRNPTFVEILLRAVARLREPLTQLIAGAQDVRTEALIRGLIKRWLLVLLDPKAQVALLTLAGVDVTGGALLSLDVVLPGLLTTDDGLATTPLFEQLVGPRLSLVQLAQLIEAHGVIHHVEDRPLDDRLVALNVLITGVGDRKILRALFGDERLVAWDWEPKARELDFWASERSELSAARRDAANRLAELGVALEHWLVELPAGPARGFVMLFMDGELYESELGSCELDLRHDGRSLCEIEIGEHFGPLVAVVEHPGLKPCSTWDDVVRDAAWEQVVASVRAASRELFARACAGLERAPVEPRRWLARVLLRAAARDRELRRIAVSVPLLSTVDARTLSLADARARVAEDRQLGFTSRDAGFAPLDDPPVVVAEGTELDDLRELLGDVLVDASERVRHHRVYPLLEHRPVMREATLDPASTLVRLPIRGSGQVGELGLSRVRSDPGVTLELGVAGHRAGVIHSEQGFFVPVDAAVIDDELPLDSQGDVDTRSKRVQALVRQCRRRAPELVLALCKRWRELSDDERPLAWRLLLRHLAGEAKLERRKLREQAFAAAAAISGFRDVRGRLRSLADLLERKGPIEVLVGEQHRGLELDLPKPGQFIVVVDADELACLQAHREVRVLDEVWEQTLADLRALARAPEVESPKNVQQLALAYRKAMAAGGIECELWIPRDEPLLESVPQLIFARAGREIGRGRVSEALPCAGIIRGDALTIADGELELDERQQTSLERQLVIMYIELATRFADDKMGRADHERALEYLSWAAAQLDRKPLRSHGKHTTSLQYALDRVVPPSLRKLVGAVKPEPPPVRPAPEPAPEPAPSVEAPKQWPSAPSTPEQRLLAAVYEQLHWARSRHPLLDQLLLNHLQLRAGLAAGELARREHGVLSLDRNHPIVARLLGQDPHDPIDLAFLLAALYSLLNYEAEAISDDDERLFVAQLAETLAISRRVPATS